MQERVTNEAQQEAGLVDGRAWFVLHTKPRQEKALGEWLANKGIEHYLPLQTQVRYYGRRKMRVELPLFPSYIFLLGQREEAFDADRTKRLVQIIPVTDQQQFAWEVQNIRRALQEQAPLEPYPYLQAGVRAEVRSGPMKGLQGMIEDRATPTRLILQVATLGQAVSVEIDGSLLEPIEQ